MDKHALLQKILTQLETELDVLVKAARHTYETATHEENKAENKYDTRALEASYLARGQAKRAAEIRKIIKHYQDLPLAKMDRINLGAVFTLETEDQTHQYFLGPMGGGIRIKTDSGEITVVTAASPLGKSLLGKEVDDEIMTPGGQIAEITEIR